MTTPRTIWAPAPQHDCIFAARDRRMDERDHRYHHDDVVLELADLLHAAVTSRVIDDIEWQHDVHEALARI